MKINIISKLPGKADKKTISLRSKHFIIGILLMLPALASILVFKYLPMIMGSFISFFDFDIVNMPGKFVGLQNYIRAFTDKKFYTTISHNLIMFVYSMLMNFWVPIFMAILINEIRKGKTFFRVGYFIPGCAPGIAMAVLWKYFWQPDYGLANHLIGLLGISPQLWLNDPNWVYFCLYFPGLVICGGMNLVIYLAALQNVSQELYEAAMIDGAGIGKRIFHVTLPQIGSSIALLFSLSLIAILNQMENVMVMTNGGPYGTSETVLLYAYKQAVNSYDYSYAMTMITIVFIVSLVMNIVVNWMKDRER